jgi:hypothetical protein
MVPLGLLVLSVDLPPVRRARRRLTVWWHRDKNGEKNQMAKTGQPNDAEDD